MKPFKLILDYTKTAKKQQHEKATTDYLMFPDIDDTVLTLWYADNGEHAATFPEVRTASAGRKAAKTFMKYCPNCDFIDKTK